jgi:phosphatidate cytidylyltransferase
MVLVFAGLMFFDKWLDGVIPAQASKLCILIALISIPAGLEMASLIETGAKPFRSILIVGSILLAASWYWRQFWPAQQIEFHLFYILSISVLSLFAVLIYQARRFGTEGVIANCSANFFALFYLGLFSSFLPGIRIEFGLGALLMFVFVVKSADIGAYIAGSLWGRHKFSPRISPGKTWEGMAGAIAAAIIVAVGFAGCFDIMNTWQAVVFGFCFAFVGQMGDLAESMLKRDARQKDSSSALPGFGGILDVIDSPLAAAPLGYLFFVFSV